MRLPCGLTVPARRSVINDKSVTWDGDEPVPATPTASQEEARSKAAMMARVVGDTKAAGADVGLDVDPSEL